MWVASLVSGLGKARRQRSEVLDFKGKGQYPSTDAHIEA